MKQLAGQEIPAKSQTSFEVIVLDDPSGDPISGAEVRLIPGPAPLPDPERSALVKSGWDQIDTSTAIASTGVRSTTSIRTDGSGKCVFRDVEVGLYRLTAYKEELISSEYGAPFAGKPGTALTLPTKGPIVMRLSPSSTIEGTVTDTDDNPVAGISVYLLSPYFSPDEPKSFTAVKQTLTQPNGEFRITGIVPGLYALVSGRDPVVNAVGVNIVQIPAAKEQQRKKIAYGWSYYPGNVATEPSSYIDLSHTRQFSGVKLVVSQQILHNLRGSVLDFDKSSARVMLSVLSLAPFRIPGQDSRRIRATYPISKDGSFEFGNLEDGTYLLTTVLNQNSPNRTLQVRESTREISIEVALEKEDVEDVRLRSNETTPIQGRVRTKEDIPLARAISPSVVNLSPPARLQLRFMPVDKLMPNVLVIPNMTDGTFTVKAFSGKYRVSIPMLGAYITEIECDGIGTRDFVVEIPKGTGKIDVIIGENAGSIQGTVVDELSKPIAAIVYGLLLPDPLPQKIGFYRSFMTIDNEGHFFVEGLPAGSYRIFAWAGVDDQTYFDPDVLAKSNIRATPVKVQPGSRLSVNARLINLR